MPRVILKPPVEDVQRIPISVTASRSMSGEKPDPSRAAQRTTSTKYKEKFNAMRQKYEQVTARHEEYQREIETANAKIKKLQAENDLLLDVISTGAVNICPHPPPTEPPQPNFHHPPHPYRRPQESTPNNNYPHGQLPPPPLPQPNSRHHPSPHPHVHPHSHQQHPHHRSPHLIQVNGGGPGPGPGTGTGTSIQGSGGAARNGYPGISTSHTRTMPMESHERNMVGPAPLPPPLSLSSSASAGPQAQTQAGGRGSTPNPSGRAQPTPTPPPRPSSAEYREPNGRHN